jgi:hypothetical protein
MKGKDFDPQRVLDRAAEIQTTGLDEDITFGTAWLEERIRLWPESWGNDLRILIYGDFDPPTAVLEIPSLGITVFPDKQKNTIICLARCVLEATVRVGQRSVPALIDAVRRINVFLGAYTLVEWGNDGIGWWCWVTHDTRGGVVTKLAHDDLPRAVDGILRLPPEVRQKVDAALYWIREPRNLLRESHRNDVLRVYSSYWNAFECLVEAVIAIRPMAKLDRRSTRQMLDDFVNSRGGRLTPADVQECYQQVVSPGFFGKATHALRVCFGNEADHYIHECFRLPDKKNRLYDLRNAINHGGIDAENPEELLRVKSRLARLWIIVWSMFGRLVPFPAPSGAWLMRSSANDGLHADADKSPRR